MASGSVLIRSYEPRDCEAVRQICCDTAARGEPVEHFFSDREVFADLLTRYYIEEEPNALWIAEHDGQAVAYLTGCLDDRRYHWSMYWNIVPSTVTKAVSRGVWLAGPTWRLLLAGLRTKLVAGGRARASLEDYPGHLHVNVRQDFRGQQIGTRLVERFLAQVRKAELPGIHAAVRNDNLPSCRLFQKLGFVELDRHRIVFPHGNAYVTHETIIFAKRM